MGTGTFEAIIKQNQPFHLADVEQGLRLYAAFELGRAQQFRVPGSDSMGLWCDQPELAVMGEAESAPVADCSIDIEVQFAAPPAPVNAMLMRRLA